MIRVREGKVIAILAKRPGATEILVEVDGNQDKAINYDHLTGDVAAGDTVILNTTAVTRKLGTGGYHYVMANLRQRHLEGATEGHIMKLRYTPCQVQVLAVEEDASPFAAQMRDAVSLKKTPVVIGTLHSMLAPVTAVIQAVAPGLKVVYVMTDGGALPLYFSRLIPYLRTRGYIQTTVTCGDAFGGDLEAVNIYTGLLAAKVVAGADVIVVSMGPGIVGTGSPFGHTAVEQGEIVNAANILEGLPIAVPRISFADPRQRHYGISHHTLTALGKIALTPCLIPIPKLVPVKEYYLLRQLDETGLLRKHRVVQVDADHVFETLKRSGIPLETMGRGLAEDPDFFLTAGAAGLVATVARRNPEVFLENLAAAGGREVLHCGPEGTVRKEPLPQPSES